MLTVAASLLCYVVLTVAASWCGVLAVVAAVYVVLCRVPRVSVLPAAWVCNGVIVCLVALLAYSARLYAL